MVIMMRICVLKLSMEAKTCAFIIREQRSKPRHFSAEGADVSASCDCSEHMRGKVEGKPECTMLAFKEINEDCPSLPCRGVVKN